ncbi:uncharacterized protein N7477_009587 [Penicillium maclennaniae]|uniref:uncharacterized protein n=1 Tax=Penicillium maclennaniae TaxID=1343394 RepID=UPI0025404088|nr:uncharacterized protein N7477_009587 [Penicillium maclennaniae]KAJ5661971.1 hypothetical protein N7477_009587 [Penicillium maclennaniae]
MRVAAVTSLVAFAVSAAGIVITSPKIGEKVDFSEPVTIKWQRVSTDPTTVDIVLVNEDVYPPVTETVASGIDTDKGSYTMKAHSKDVSDTDTGAGYQVNFLSPSGGILAQSQQFKVTDPKAEASSSGKKASTASEMSTASMLSSTLASTTTTSATSASASYTSSSTASSSPMTTHSSTSASSHTTSSSSNTASSTSSRTSSSMTTSTSASSITHSSFTPTSTPTSRSTSSSTLSPSFLRSVTATTSTQMSTISSPSYSSSRTSPSKPHISMSHSSRTSTPGE